MALAATWPHPGGRPGQGATITDAKGETGARQVDSGTIMMAPQGHSETQMPHPLQ